MKLMHLADFHLDSAFSGFDKDRAEQKREELRSCFVRAMQIAKQRKVELVLISGDLFDTPFCTLATRKTVFGSIKEVGCPVVIAPGNHDYYNKNGTYADKDLPENAYVFTSDELGRFDFDELGVSVVGYAFTSDRYDANPLGTNVPLSENNVNILCAHTELGAPLSKYAPMSTGAISGCGFTYAALGHVHVPPAPANVGSSLIAYSGFPQGRSFDELGAGGAYIVDIDLEQKRASCERVTLSTLTYEIEKIDVTGADDDSYVEDKISEIIKTHGYGENTALRVVLEGSVVSDYAIDEGRLSALECFSHLALLQIKNKTAPNFDLAYLVSDTSVRGEVYRTLLPLLESSDENERQKGALALKFALAALDKRELTVD